MSVKKKTVSHNHKNIVRNHKSALKNAKSAAFCNRNKGIGDREKGIGSRGRQSAVAHSQDIIASLEAQMASFEAQIALLKEEGIVGSRKSEVGSKQSVASNLKLPTHNSQLPTEEGNRAKGRMQNEECRMQNDEEKNSAFCTLHSALPSESPLPDPIPLHAPPIMPPTAGSNCIHLEWGKVNNASGYIIQVSNNSTFTAPVTHNINATATSWSISGLQPETTYYLRILTIGTGLYANSGFSSVPPVTTLAEGEGGTNPSVVGDLQNWMNNLQTEFQNVAALVPQLDNTNLNAAARKRLLGSGVRRYGFIEKVFEVSGDFPQFWPPFGAGRNELDEYIQEIDVLRNLLVWFRYAARVVQDMLLIAGDEAFRTAGTYYTLARDGARRRNPEAQQVFEMLRLFWKRPRRITEEPTIPELHRDINGLLHGTKEGTITISNESDQVIKGERVIIDNVVPKPRGGVKIVEESGKI